MTNSHSSAVANAVERSDAVLQKATTEYDLDKVFAAVSGGNDSQTALSVAHQSDNIELDGVIFIDTGINVYDTKEYVKQQAEKRDLEFFCVDRSYVSDKAQYEHLVKVHGFPGPPIHNTMFNNLKGKRVYNFFKEQAETDDDISIGVISGVLADESDRRMENIGDDPLEEKTRSVWISPLFDWKEETVTEYRSKHDLVENDVTALLHVSGDCNCGAYGRRSEITDLQQFYPQAAKKIKQLEREVVKRVEQGKIPAKYGLWGHGRTDKSEMDIRQDNKQTGFDLCSGCENRCGVEYTKVGRSITTPEAYLRSDEHKIGGPMSVYCVDCDIIVEDGRKHREEVHPEAKTGPDNLDIRAIPHRCSDIGGFATTEGEISTKHPDGDFCDVPHEQHDWVEYEGPNNVARRQCNKCGAFEVPVDPNGGVTTDVWPNAAAETPHDPTKLTQMHDQPQKKPAEMRDEGETSIIDFL